MEAAMSIVAMSETAGSLGREIGRQVASSLGYEFADREIIADAADRFGQDLRALTHAADESPTLREHLEAGPRRYAAFIEASVLEMAARDDVVLVGRASTVILRDVPHALRVRVDAPEALRAERVARAEGVRHPAALARVRESDRGLGGRVRFLYHADWNDPLLYDLVLNTERLDVGDAVRAIVEALSDDRFRRTDAARRATKDRALVSHVSARLLADPRTRTRPLEVTCADGVVTLAGVVDAAQVWAAVEEVVAQAPGVAGIRNEIGLVGDPAEGRSEAEERSHAGFLHGEGRGWGGYGGDWYDREWEALQRYRATRGGQRREAPGPVRSDS
jgi:cytidylate kinase